MNKQHVSERAPESVGGQPAPPAPLPNEAYYRRPPAPAQRANTKWLGIALIVIGVIGLGSALSGRSLFWGGLKSIELADEVFPGKRIAMSVGSSDVEVQPWDQQDIRVEVIQHGGSRGDYTVEIESSGDTVRASHRSNCFIFCWNNGQVHYRISIPRNTAAEIETLSGDIAVSGAGDANLRTMSGDIDLRDIAGNSLNAATVSGDVKLKGAQVEQASIRTTSGEINIDEIAGDLELRSISGDIEVRDAQVGHLTASTTSGSLDYVGGLGKDSAHNITSVSGDVRLRLPGDSGFLLNASTISGDLESAFTLNDAEEDRRSLNGKIGAGGALLTITTTSGDISIQQQ